MSGIHASNEVSKSRGHLPRHYVGGLPYSPLAELPHPTPGKQLIDLDRYAEINARLDTLLESFQPEDADVVRLFPPFEWTMQDAGHL